MIPRIKFDITWLAQQMVNRIPSHYFENKKTRFLDPAIGGGQVAKPLEDRVKYKVNDRVFGCESELLYVDYAKNSKGLQGTYTAVKYEDITKKGFSMEFDVIVGNFPFTESPGQARKKSGNSNNSTLYDDFLDMSFKTARYINVIIPAGWTKKSAQSERYKKQGLKSVIFLDAKKVFPDVAIRSGITVVEFNQGYDGPIEITTTSGHTYSQPRHLPIQNVDPMIKGILEKIDDLGGLNGAVRHGDYPIPKGTKGSLERLLANSKSYSGKLESEFDVPVLLYSGGEHKDATWAYADQIRPSSQGYKVIFPKASDRYVLGKVRILSPGQGVSSALYYINCSSKQEAEKWKSWLEHPVIVYSLQHHKTNDTVNTYNNSMHHIPKCPQCAITDKEIRKLFGFNKDEWSRIVS